MNGARVTGYKLRIGYTSIPTLTVGGSSPLSGGGHELGQNGSYPFTLNVADVTGDAAVDFFISGSIGDYPDSNLGNMPLVKTGDGTVSFSAANSHTGMVTVAAGTLALAANDALNTTNDVVLSGGTLAMVAVTNVCGTLTRARTARSRWTTARSPSPTVAPSSGPTAAHSP
jgi:autotransporter-associated beta strand protein